jgi:AAA15 family ATPase/GTPase
MVVVAQLARQAADLGAGPFGPAKECVTMQIKTITANNFKSLVDFKLDLSKFTCLIGLNGAGKSTVLQFVDLLAQQVRGDIKGWLSERSWRSKDMKSQLTKKSNIDFSVQLTGDSGD